jgi:K+-transporting ATPase ATPase A chain
VTTPFYLQIAVALLLTMLLAYPLGMAMANTFDRRPSALDTVFGPIERGLLRLLGIRGTPNGMSWQQYVAALLCSNLFMVLIIYEVLCWQGQLPWNPQHFNGLEATLAFNTAVSFITNTNWQAYTGEATLSNFTQMAGITFPMFTSAATGFAAAIAFMRAITGRPSLGNFYEDIVRFIVRLMLPISVLGALFMCFQGVPQSLDAAIAIKGPQGTAQTLVVGPVASLESVKHLGTNGGGFYGQNSSHPFENPTPLTNVFEFVLMSALPIALVFTFGRMLGSARQANIIFAAMALMFLCFLGVLSVAETSGTTLLSHSGLDQAASLTQAGGNMEGKEVRFGQAQSVLFTAATCAFTTGTVNSMHDSLTPLGGFVPLAEMMLNNIFGGKGVGFLNFVLYGILAVFLTGLMVGRTPEFLGKKIEKPEIVLASLAILLHPLLILLPTAWSVIAPYGLAGISNNGSHGLSEILYAYTSAAANNGSAFAGLSANTPWYNLSLGVVMLLGRYISIIALMAIAGSLMAKKRVPEGPGTLRTDTPLFGGLWLATILIIGALTFFPVVALGPIAEHIAMVGGKQF